MDRNDEIRSVVSKTYAKRVTTPAQPSCCGPSKSDCGAAKLAGYGDDELAALPLDAVEHSFGCGDPLSFAEVKEGDVVVDLGSGAGIDILLAARKVGPTGRAIGVDMTDEMIDKARGNIAAAGLRNAEVRKGLIEELPIASGSADWVISNCVINLSPEKDRVFAEIARVLKPGGRMLVSDIVAHDLPDWARSSDAFLCACVGGAISEEEYAAGLKRAGLTDVEVRARFSYSAEQIVAFAESTECSVAAPCCGDGAPSEDLVKAAAEELAGRVASVKFAARKPG